MELLPKRLIYTIAACLVLSALTLLGAYILITCQVFFSQYYDRVLDMLVITIIGPVPVLWLIVNKQLNKARILFILSMLLSMLYIFIRRTISNVDSHVELNFIWLSLLTHLLFDYTVAWLLTLLYLSLFIAARITTVLWLSKSYDLDESSSAFIALCMGCWAVYAAKSAVTKIQRELDYKQAQLVEQRAELIEMNSVKDKLFNIIGHDLRSPIASLRLLANTESLLYENDFIMQ